MKTFFIPIWYKDLIYLYAKNWNWTVTFWWQIKIGQKSASKWAGLAVSCQLVAQKAIAIFQLLAYFFNPCTKYEKHCQMTVTSIPWHYLNYYFSYDVCASFRVSVLSVFLQKKNSLWRVFGEQTSRILEFKPEGLDF